MSVSKTTLPEHVASRFAALRDEVIEHGSRFGCWKAGAIQDSILGLEAAVTAAVGPTEPTIDAVRKIADRMVQGRSWPDAIYCFGKEIQRALGDTE